MDLTQDELDYINLVVETSQLDLFQAHTNLCNELKAFTSDLLEELAQHEASYAQSERLLDTHLRAANIVDFPVQPSLESNNHSQWHPDHQTLLSIIDDLPHIVEGHGMPRSWRFTPYPSVRLLLSFPRASFHVDSLSLTGACINTFPLYARAYQDMFSLRGASLVLPNGHCIHVDIASVASRGEHRLALKFDHYTVASPTLKVYVVSNYVRLHGWH
ncbi:hypothetical protein [Pseudoalteromonas viridis]|uniref:PilZ domain-containing protein n=1 Tax=Pseudoalteromonas viridis TaxID=339617 RepID=A0ABX7VDX1_9GAMM|nr:hypothetical protein [Pseudoalteromonas viridis]QTL37445.1 hypothetical protein J5X90_21605 [Pseudoalteromonas viridis]